MKLRPLPLLLALVLAPAGAFAQPAQPDPERAEEARKEMEALRRQMAELGRRMAELSRESGNLHDQIVTRIETRREAMQRPVIGVILGSDANGAVQLRGVTPEGPAARAGLRAGDVLLGIDGKAITGTTAEERLESARKLLGDLTEGQEVRLAYQRDGQRAETTVKAEKSTRVMVFGGSGEFRLPGANGFSIVVPGIDMEIGRIAPFAGCPTDEDCALPLLSQAFRWRGLNLASVDAQLGRYFGTDRGVLVLRGPEDFPALQSGDVILKIDGMDVNSPREAMRELQEKQPGDLVLIELLRDRRPQTVEITAPETSRAFQWMMPPLLPAPPAPPAPPKPPKPPQAAAPDAPGMHGIVATIVLAEAGGAERSIERRHGHIAIH
ncbi:MAG: PDZ domain-containing protein [Rehaibacterium terrae]|uniref:PDZ domain-containing protein n=1 Tax=Rehaibacterium terrae TaxID=1341696 RepID=UPI00391C870C